jgi:hypothetical protein
MSQRNGDKARFDKNRKRKAALRQRNRELRRAGAESPPIHAGKQRAHGSTSAARPATT